MASVCPNAASAEANYAGPMPIIGLYIAAATAVCFLLILLDFVFAYNHEKPWIPCRFFSLNSFTLTVMGVSTKLSVDLTTYMPGLDGQLSKLCSTVFICISMGFFMPSLGTMKGSDRYSNLISLTILVVTIIVNVCMQISTGVIFSFVVEHIVIMIFMFILLLSCWSSSLEIDDVHSLESCFGSSYISNLQMLMCEYSHCTTIGLLSSLCFTILLEAILRATFLKEFEICMELSDYKWSIWVVVAAQFFTCAVGCLSITWRWISMVFRMEPNNNFSIEVRGRNFSEWKQLVIYIWKFNTNVTLDWDIHFMPLNHLGSGALRCFLFLQSFLLFLCFGIQVISNFIDELVLFVTHKLRIYFPSAPTKTQEESDDEFDNIGGYEYKKELRKWLERKSEDDLKKWKKKNESNLSQLLSELSLSMLPYPSNHQLQKMEETNKCRMLVVVLRCAKVALPSNMVDSLLNAFDEAFQVICFVEEVLNSNLTKDRFSLRMAQVLWMTRDIDSATFYKRVIQPANSTDEESQSSVFQRALNIFEEMLSLLSNRFDNEYKTIDEEILRWARELNTINELYDVIKQFVLFIMHFYLSLFPIALDRYIMDSEVDKYEARIKLVVKLDFKLEGLEDKIRWQPLPIWRPQGYVIGVNATASSEVLAKVPIRDDMGSDVVKPSDVLVKTTTTEDITEI